MKIRRIMLVQPGARTSYQAFGQPLGLLYLISILRRDFPGEFEIELVEQALYALDQAQMRERIQRFDPDLIGFSALSVNAEEMHRLAALAKQLKPSCWTVLGGPHASMFYDQALQDPHLDVAVINEGEITFPELLRALRDDRPLEEVPGLAFRKDKGRSTPELFRTPPQPHVADLDSIPFPAWDLIDFHLYGKQVSMNGNCYYPSWAMIFTSRACPYRCIYCHNLFGKTVRYRSVENVLEEIELLVRQYGVRELHIVDDIFNLDLERAKRICDEIIRRNLKLKIAFPNAVRGDRMDRELIHKLKQAGCYAITYAVETASPRLQKVIQKNLNLDKVREAIAWTREEGITPQGFFMLGFPGETVAEMKQTVDWAIRSRLLRAWFFTVVVYPRTELFELARRTYPDFDFAHWDLAAQRCWAENDFYTRVTGVSMVKIRRSAIRRFFIRPWLLPVLIWRTPKNWSLVHGIYLGLRVVFFSLFKVELIFRLLKKLWNRSRRLFVSN